MYVSVVFVIRFLYSTVSLTLGREQRFIRIIIISSMSTVSGLIFFFGFFGGDFPPPPPPPLNGGGLYIIELGLI